MLLVLVSLGAVGALLVATALGMKGSELAHLAGLLGPAIVVTVAAALLASRLLRRTSLRQRYLAVAAVGSLVALGNLVALTRAMFVSAHAATVLAVVLIYASAAGLAAAFASARSSVAALDRVTGAARRIGDGDLSARVGTLDAGLEFDRLAGTLDEMAARLQGLRDQEQQVERIRRDLVTAVSHDLRTPLANLRAMAEAIDDAVVDDRDTLLRYAREMQRAVGQLSALVDDLFEFAQVDSLTIEDEMDRARLGDVVAAAMATVEAEAERKRLRMTTVLDAAEDVPCSRHLTRVVQNLLVNAVRHTGPDGSVRVEGHREMDRVRLAVEDTGEGIPARDLPFVFDPFYRVDSARAGNGAGLGLALADRIVRALGGTIDVTSDPGRGARFDIALPLGPTRGLTASGAGPGTSRTRNGDRRGSGSRHPS
jgi:signal transduction histidine kinase